MFFDVNCYLVIFMTLQFYHIVVAPTPQYYNSHYHSAPRPSLPTTSSYGTGTNVGGNSRTVPFSWKSSENSQTFWEDDPNYPIEDIKKLGNLLRDKYQFFFSNEKIPFEESEMISPRLGGGEEYGLCDSFHRTVYPKKAESKQNQVLTIINTPEFMQGVSVEMCSSPGSACTHDRLFPLGTTSNCKQHYTWHRLVALTMDGKTIADYFRFPSCCKCILTGRKTDFSSYNRFGGDDSTPPRSATTKSPQRTETLFTFSP